MGFFSNKVALALLILLILIVLIPLIVFLILAQQNPRHNEQTPRLTPSSEAHQTLKGVTYCLLISCIVPAVTASRYAPASSTNDLSYDTSWCSEGSPVFMSNSSSNSKLGVKFM